MGLANEEIQKSMNQPLKSSTVNVVEGGNKKMKSRAASAPRFIKTISEVSGSLCLKPYGRLQPIVNNKYIYTAFEKFSQPNSHIVNPDNRLAKRAIRGGLLHITTHDNLNGKLFTHSDKVGSPT